MSPCVSYATRKKDQRAIPADTNKVISGRLLLMAMSGLAATIFWDSALLAPVKLLVVFVHELWHGITALAAGARLERIILHWPESGETMVSRLGGSAGFLFSASAGYIGTALVGAVLLNRGLRARFERLTLFSFALALFYMSYLFTDPGQVAFFTGIGWALCLALIALPGRTPARITLIVLGSLFLWYCIYDMFDFARDIQNTDAGILAAYMRKSGWFGLQSGDKSILPELVISALFCLAVLIILAVSVQRILRPEILDGGAGDSSGNETPPFPGELTPEVEAWLWKRGIGPDGEALPEDILQLRDSMQAEPAAHLQTKPVVNS